MKKVLLMNMPSSIRAYGKSALKGIMAPRPFLSMAELGASVIYAGGDCRVLDLQSSLRPFEQVEHAIQTYRPDMVGMTFTTLLFDEAKRIARFIKQKHPDLQIITGGVHSSIYPEEVAKEPYFDMVVYGEGDITLQEIVKGKPLSKILGLAYKTKDGRIKVNPPRPLIKDLDELPMPAWHLFNPKMYMNPRAVARVSPVGTIGTSRGCVYGCVYCNKSVFGRAFRAKSVKRVVDEFELLINSGFKEIHVWDDMFATNLQRAKDICDEIVRRRLRFSWQLECGVRVNCVDKEFFEKCKKAGCYKVAFGFESGSDYILKTINKGATTSQARNAVRWAKEAGMETTGFFMLGLPEDTIETMDQTIKFACSLGLDYAKATILVPLPSTPLFEDFEKKGLIKTKDWSRYNFHTASKVYTHPTLDWDTLERYYDKFHKKFYFRPSYMAHRLIRSIRKGEIIDDLTVAFNTFVK